MKRRANGEGTIYEIKDAAKRRKRFRAEKYITLSTGIQKRVVALGHSRSAAWAALDVKARAVEEADPDAARLRVRAFLEAWIRHKRQSVRLTTIDTYEQDITLHINPALGDALLQRVTAGHVQELLTRLQEAGKHATADKVRRLLRQAFGQAVRWQYIARNPVEMLDPIRKPPPKRGLWQPAELRLFFAHAHGHPYAPVYMLAVVSGLRQGELLGLMWEDVGEDRIAVRRTLTEHGFSPPKTRAGVRVVPVDPRALAQLGARGAPGELVFRSRAGTALAPSNVSRAFHRIRKAAKLPSIRLHDLRRIYATLLARDGAHPRTIQALLGHSTPGLAMTVYTDVMQDQFETARLEVDLLTGGTNGGDRAVTAVSRALPVDITDDGEGAELGE